MSYQPGEKYQKLQERLTERGVETYECSVCGSTEWIGMGEGAPDTIALLSNDAEAGEPNAYPVHGFYCDNCGLVRLHHESIFR